MYKILSPSISQRAMKQEAPSTERKISTPRQSPLPVAHTRVSRATPSPESKANDNGSRVRRHIFSSKPKERVDYNDDSKNVDGQVKTRSVEQYARVRRVADSNRKDNRSDEKAKDENLVKELKSEVSNLKAQIEELKNYNSALEMQNKRLGKDLFSAEAKIKELEKLDQVEPMSKVIQSSDSKNARQLIADKLEIHQKIQLTVPPSPLPTLQSGPPPPPPPPPPSRKVSSRVNTTQNATSLVELYHSITKRGGNQNCSSPVANNKAHNSIVDELQNRSTHLLAIKADVEKKGNFINQLIQKVQSMAFIDIEDVLTFVDWLDGQLSTLADERAVLKHFNWPERKADALREASFEYRDLKKLLHEVSSFEDDSSLTCESILRKITTLLDKSERSIQRLVRLRDTNMTSFKECKIPTEWMLDLGMISKIKLASGRLANVYIKRVSRELGLASHTESELKQEALLLQSVHFAYRAYQFGGGLDSETMRAFEELRNRVQLHT